MKRFLIPLLAALALPTAVNAEVTYESIFNAKQADYFLKSKQASKLISEGKFSEAKTICDELIEISPDNPNSYICKGIALGYSSKKIRKSREALKNFTKAIEIEPENYEAYFLRGVLQFRMRRKHNSKLDRTACNDIKKAYLNNHPLALEYVKENKYFLIKDRCSGFF